MATDKVSYQMTGNSKLHGKQVFTASPESIQISYLPGGGYRYKIDNRYSRSVYYNIASAKADSRRVQVIHEDGHIEPYESAKQFGRL